MLKYFNISDHDSKHIWKVYFDPSYVIAVWIHEPAEMTVEPVNDVVFWPEGLVATESDKNLELV